MLLLLLAAPATRAEQGPAPLPSEPRPATGRLVLGYYVPYDTTSWASLQAQARSIDVVAVQWVTIDACGRLTSDDDQTLKQFARSQGIRVVPSLLTNSSWLNHRILTDAETTSRALDQIVEYVVSEGYDGFDLDLESVPADDRVAYGDFVRRLGEALHERGKLLALAIPPKTRDSTTGFAGAYDYALLAQHADLVTVMGYEWHGAWSGPGPIAPHDEVDKVVAFAVSQMPLEKVVLALAFYGWDWNTTSGGSRYIGYPEAAALAERYGAPMEITPNSHSATFRYRAPAGEQPPAVTRPPSLNHEITTRRPPRCPVADPAPVADPDTPAGPAAGRRPGARGLAGGARERRRTPGAGRPAWGRRRGAVAAGPRRGARLVRARGVASRRALTAPVRSSDRPMAARQRPGSCGSTSRSTAIGSPSLPIPQCISSPLRLLSVRMRLAFTLNGHR